MTGIAELLKFPGMNFATTPTTVTGAEGGDGAGGAGGAGGGAGSPAGAGGAGGGGVGTGTGPAPTESPNIVQLREAYQGIKSKYEPWEKLGLQPDQVSGQVGTYQKMYSAAAELGRNLGFPDEEIMEALAEDPVATIDWLRNEAQRVQSGQEARGGQGEDLQELIQSRIDQAIGPIQERENVRATDEANSLFDRTIHQEAVNLFKKEGIDVAQIPQDEMFMITSAASEILKYNDKALQALKFSGDTTAVKQAFQEAVTYLDKYYIARSGRERVRVVGPGGRSPARPGAPAAGRQPTLDEMIDDPSLIDKAQGRTGADARYGQR
jgi:hypothetical protein